MKNANSIAGLVILSIAVFAPAFSVSAAPQLVSTLNSAAAAPANGNGDSWAPLLTPDGRFVLFASTADNLCTVGNGNGMPRLNPPSINVFLRDRLNRTTTLVSANLSGTGGGNGNSFPAGLSTNGQFVLFESGASDLVANHTNNVNDVFLRDTVNQVTWLVSVATNGACANGASRGSTLTPDGRFVAFTSLASNLVTQDANGIADVFVRDMQAGATVLASVGAMGSGPTNGSEAPEISSNGRFVAFYSTAAGLAPGAPTTGDIYVRDLQAGTTAWASANARALAGFGTGGFCFNQAISDNGQYVAFEIMPSSSIATNGCILRFKIHPVATDLISTNAVDPLGWPVRDMRSLNMSSDGRFVTYLANLPGAIGVYLWDSQVPTNILVSVNVTNGAATGLDYWPDLDATGQHVIFSGTDTNLTARAAAGIFVRNPAAGTTLLASVGTNGMPMAVTSVGAPALAANGGSVAFETQWANLDGRNFESDVFARDLTNPVAELVSVHDPNLASVTPNGPSLLWLESVSSNGQFVAFSSAANDLAANDTNGAADVFVCDLSAGTTTLVSAGSSGFPGNGFSTEPALSADGRYVAFTSVATNLVTGDTNRATDVFIRDRQANTTTLVSVAANGGFPNGDSDTPLISTDARYIFFCSRASNIRPVTAGTDNLFVYDRQAGQTYNLTTSGYIWFSMTPDGREAAFVAATNGYLYVWNSQLAALVYTNSGMPTYPSISPDGHWLAFVSNSVLYARDLVANTNRRLAPGRLWSRAGLKFSADSRFITYAGTNDVYIYDFTMSTNYLVSHSLNGVSLGSGASDFPVISPDGRFVAYRSFASNCVASDPSGLPDVLLFDRLTGSNFLAGANWPGVADNSRYWEMAFSGDGQKLFLESGASHQVAGDYNLDNDILALSVAALTGATSTNPPAPLVVELQFPGSDMSGQPVVITWPVTDGQTYAIQFKDNLTDPTWQNLAVTITVNGHQASATDAAPSAAHRFYRVVEN